MMHDVVASATAVSCCWWLWDVCRCYDKHASPVCTWATCLHLKPCSQTLLTEICQPHQPLHFLKNCHHDPLLSNFLSLPCATFAMPAAVHPGGRVLSRTRWKSEGWRPQFQTNKTMRFSNPHIAKRSKNMFTVEFRYVYICCIVWKAFYLGYMVGVHFAGNVSELPWPFLIGWFTKF